MAKQKAELPVLTRRELQAAKEACEYCKQLDQSAAKAKKEKESCLAQVFFKMGFQADEVKALSPHELADAIERAVGREFQLEADAFAEFALVKTYQGKYPQWKKELQAIASPVVIAEIESETATQYSYAVIEAAAAAPGAAGVFVLAPEPEAPRKRAAAK